ncbi:hypothetical protein CBS101457_003274 [Exobasidium rhododendri]|nr:hypothetical protein CBS101457_003274 [Exobasidium rhododendri]
MSSYKARIILKHVKDTLSTFKGKRPMIVGMQGPQGSGKTTVTERVKQDLLKEGRRIAVFSLDDLYKTHEDMLKLAHDNPSNALLQGRGQPGTHDMDLGRRLLSQLRNSADGTKVSLPVYDKSLFQGQGERSEETIEVEMPLEVVIFEGWCMGFYPLSEVELQRRIHDCNKVRGEEEVWQDEAVQPYFASHSVKSLFQINNSLRSYLDWYDYIDAFIQLKPDNLQNVFAWRLQAEHAMKDAGKDGMSDVQVHDFVARYMPGYELFGEGVTKNDTPWSGYGLQITLDAHRDVVNVARF